MNIAIYSRKSKFTGKGDSIENQIEMCNDYINAHFGKDCMVSVYEDEGFTGANTDRPRFKQCLTDIKAKKINLLICYRLDRISRNVADFSSTLEILEDNNCDFVSIKEQFDTSTPMGRAMMYIASVFAQLERETIAERVRDNMLQLSKTGRWLGGKAPFGFASQELSSIDTDGKVRKQYQLVHIPTEVAVVKFLYTKFLELGSLIKLQSYLSRNNIKTTKDKDYNLSSLKFILTNPVYVCADPAAYDYFISKKYNVCSEQTLFDGSKGIMSYNKTNQTKKAIEKREISECVIAISNHEPIISSAEWIKTQTLMDLNKDKSFRKVHSQDALLSGLLRCKCCGSYMRPKRSRMSADGTKYHFYYICELKEKSNGVRCNVKNLAGHSLDANIVEQLTEFSKHTSSLMQQINADKLKLQSEQLAVSSTINSIKDDICSREDKINNLLATLELSKDSIASKYIINQINSLASEVQELNEKLTGLEDDNQSFSTTHTNFDMMVDTLKNFNELYTKSSLVGRRELIRIIITSLSWDGEHLDGKIFGGNSLGEF